MSLPFVMLSGPLLGWGLGVWLDGRYHTTWIMPVAVLVGLAGSINLAVKLIREISS